MPDGTDKARAEIAATPTPTRAIALLALASFASAANLRVCDPLLPQIAGELGVTVGTAAMTAMAFALGYGVFQILVGPLADARGKLLVVVLGSMWAGIATTVAAAMPSLEPLVLMRFLAGAGGAAIIPVAIAWIGDVVPYQQRQAVLARYISGQILGIVFGQAAGGLLGQLFGWRATLLILAAVHIAAGVLLLAEMRRLRVPEPETGGAGWLQSAASAARLLQDGWVRTVLISVLVEGMAMFGALAYVGAELHERFGLSLGAVGGLLASFGAGALFYSANAGWIVPRLGQPGLAALGAICLAGGYATLALMPWAWLAVPAIALVGLGFYMLHNTLQTNATQMAPEARGLAVSLFAFTLFCAQSIGITLAAPVMDRYGGRPIFLSAAVIVLGVAFWFRHRLVRRPS
ncbi:MAG TPA: MFS transporter [Hyphomicrobiaceae bacterium]|nr:MFS transporter [Hyphomicrobiaceae bacterium]